MKKLFGSIALSIVAVVMVASGAMAYQATLNVTGERMQSNNATQGTVAAAYYNPAGLVTLGEGFYVDLGNRFLGLNKYGENAAGVESESETWTFLLPNAAAVWRVGAGALFLTFDIRDGGAGGSWDDADSITVVAGLNSSLMTAIEGESYTFGVTFGGSAKLNDMIAFSGALRYLQLSSTTEYEGNLVNNSAAAETVSESAYGWQGVFGVMLTPMQGLNVTLQWTTETVLTGKETSEFANGTKTYDAVMDWKPNMLQFGVGYEVAQGVLIQLSYNLTLDGESFFDNNARSGGQDDAASHMIGIGAQYKIMDLLAVSFGMSYHIDGNDDNNGRGDPTNPQLDKLAFGAGVVVTPMENLNIEMSLSYSLYMEDEGVYTTSSGTNLGLTTTNQNAFVIGLGVSYGLSM